LSQDHVLADLAAVATAALAGSSFPTME